MKKKKYKIIEVKWIDAQSGFGNAEFVDDLIREFEPMITHSVGYLIHEDKDYIFLGFMLFGEDMVKHYQVIPKNMIVERTLRELTK